MDPGVINSNAPRGQTGNENEGGRLVGAVEAMAKWTTHVRFHPGNCYSLEPILALWEPRPSVAKCLDISREAGNPNLYGKSLDFLMLVINSPFYKTPLRPNETQLQEDAVHCPPVCEPRRGQGHGL